MSEHVGGGLVGRPRALSGASPGGLRRPSMPKRTGSMMDMPSVQVVLCGDLGGTNSRLELHRVPPDLGPEELQLIGTVPPLFKKTYKNDNVDGEFNALLEQFLEETGIPDLEIVAGCLAAQTRVESTKGHVAGPVQNDRVAFTNLSWVIDGRSIEDEFLMPKFSMRLVNDFEANGYGVVTLDEDDYEDLSPRGPVNGVQGGPVAVIGAGTGLGETFATSCANGLYTAWPSEGGHVAFAPRDELQCELLLALSNKFGGRVSTERVVSGKGIVNVYEFLANKYPDEVNAALDRQIHAETEGALIVSRGAYDDALCSRAMDIVLDCYGEEIGNAAVKWLPFGGLYIAGGIAGKNLDRIRDSSSKFMTSYLDRGRVSTVLDKIPLRLVTVDDLGLRGAHYVALSTLITVAIALKEGAPADEAPKDDGVVDKSSSRIEKALDNVSMAIKRAAATLAVAITISAIIVTRRK